ncbi:DUF2157 domain-containing protein [Robertmurraya massiliosenegalensis]|uniref:hypothetical protein n=1 Tax=Robertmurraya TaxID=2837507 RepID=UPI0039A5AB3F
MKPLSGEVKKQIVQEELWKLKVNRYIPSDLYEEVVKAHEKYYVELEVKVEPQLKPEKPLIPKVEKKVVPTQTKPRIKKTEEQIRERNITWLLNLGVILLLIGGLYVATSNWDKMSSITKAGSIGLISFLFYGIAYVSKKVLKIDKTAFAFVVLGSLFLPIFFLSVAWFELLGSYLSISGEGSNLFGMISCLLILPVYFLLANRIASRLFVWFTYLTFTVGVGYLFAALQFSQDSFFLGMMAFQALSIYLYHQLKKKDSLKLFTVEFVNFAQANLILTTVLMLVLYHSSMYLGFNLIVTAAVYLSMVYVTGRKEFHFVFSAMLVYGVFQFVEYSMLAEMGSFLYALIGFVFLLVPLVLDDQFPWKKIFVLTSAVVSGLAFLFISLEAILINLGQPSFPLLFGYLAISGNFLYLSHVTKKLLFRYLSAVFFSVVMFEGLLLLDEAVELSSFMIFVALIGFGMFAGFGIYVKVKVFELIKQPARDIGWAYMAIAAYASLTMYAWWEVAVILLFICVSAILSLTKESRLEFRPFAKWLAPISMGLAVWAFCEEWKVASPFYSVQLGPAFHFLFASLIVTAVFFIVKDKELKRNHFYTSQVFYTFALLTATIIPFDMQWLQTLLFMGGVAMYTWLYVYTKNKFVPYLMGLITLITYYSLLESIGEIGTLFAIIGAVILFIVSFMIKNRDANIYRAFGLIGHIYMPFGLLLTLFVHGKAAVWGFMIALIIYGVSTMLAEREWKRKFFLYGAFTMLFATFVAAIAHLETVEKEFAFCLTSLLIAGLWYFADGPYKKRTLYYLVPFSLIGIMFFLNMYPYTNLMFIVTILYSVGVIVVLHLSKWRMLTIIPTLFIYTGVRQYLAYHSFGVINEIITLAVFGVVFLLAGKWFYSAFYEKKEKEIPSIDVYTMIAILFFATIYGFEQPYLWMKIIPGLLIALTVWLQKNRIPGEYKWVPIFVSGAYLLQPYYAMISEISIHELLEAEVYVLPFVILSIYLRFCMKGRYEQITNYLQWRILLVVSIFLVIDGLESSTIYDALILGSLSLTSILAGVFFKTKSYFFVGTGVLLLNVFMQTRPFWGNLPWWAYLLIAGSILIAVASSNEWNKQKAARGEATIISTLKGKVMSLWKLWK